MRDLEAAMRSHKSGDRQHAVMSLPAAVLEHHWMDPAEALGILKKIMLGESKGSKAEVGDRKHTVREAAASALGVIGAEVGGETAKRADEILAAAYLAEGGFYANAWHRLRPSSPDGSAFREARETLFSRRDQVWRQINLSRQKIAAKLRE